MVGGKFKKGYKIKDDTIKKLTLYFKKHELQHNEGKKKDMHK